MQLTFNLLDWGTRVRFVLAVLAVLYVATPKSPLTAQAVSTGEHFEWLTGSAAERTLRGPAEIHWKMTPLRQALRRLARAHRIAIVLDRRIDPDQLISQTVVGGDLMSALRRVAEQRGWGVSFLSSVLYVGPALSTREIATWRQQQLDVAEELDSRTRRTWLQPDTASWPALTQPRNLIEQWTREASLTAYGIDQVSHDLWPEQGLPKLSLLDRLIVVLTGFDLAPLIQSDGHLRIVSLPKGLTVTRIYRVPAARRASLRSFVSTLDDAESTWRRGQMEVVGRAEHHTQIQDWIDEPNRPKTRRRGGDRRWTLTVKNQPMSLVLQAIASQSHLQLEWQKGTESLADQRVSLSVENVTMNELIESVLADHPLRFRISAGRLLIFRRDT